MIIAVRPGEPSDLNSIAQIQAASPEASQWDVAEYLAYDLAVAVCEGQVGGFAVWRQLGAGESELLNLAVDPAFRRCGMARRLVTGITSSQSGILWLEVRESNLAARILYKSLGFVESGTRPGYYSDTTEAAIVMKLHS